MGEKIQANKSKMSSKSKIIYFEKIEKIIDEVFDFYPKRLKIEEFTKVLTELLIINDLVYKGDLIELAEDCENDDEVVFVEQLWMILNPLNAETIKNDIPREVLKILFSPINKNIGEMSEVLESTALNRIHSLSLFSDGRPNQGTDLHIAFFQTFLQTFRCMDCSKPRQQLPCHTATKQHAFQQQGILS